jgi:hypothetical protein
VESGAARGATEVREASLGWNLGGTAGAVRGVTRGREARGDYRGGLTSRRSSSTCSGEGVLMGLTEDPDSQRKSRSVRWGEAAGGKLASSKTTCRETIRRFVERSRQR